MAAEDLSTEFDEFVRAKTRPLLRSAYLLTGDQHLAEDLVQAALERTHGAWNRLHRSGNAEAYTRKVMYHLQVAWWRRKRVKEYYSEDSKTHDAPVADSADVIVQRLALRDALSRLTPKQRAVVVLRFHDDRSIEETAEILGCSIGTVKSQTAKAIAALRRQGSRLRQLVEGSPT